MSMSVRKAGKKRSVIKPALCFLLCAAFLSGCLSGSGTGPGSAALKTIKEDTDVRESAGEPQTGQETAVSGPAERLTERAKKSLEEKRQPQIMETDWSEYFQGLNGTAVLYDAEENRYLVYNPELAETRRSPCSTFKIISSLLALENGVIDPENSVRKWSGEYFWNGEWNRDIGFEDAFHASCVWYFRQVVDDIGKERMQEGLDALRYGNCDISDWEGSLNTNNSNRGEAEAGHAPAGRRRDFHLRENGDGKGVRRYGGCLVYGLCRNAGGKPVLLRLAGTDGWGGGDQREGKGNRGPHDQ